MRRLVAMAAVLALFLVGCGDDGGDDADPLAGGPAPTDAHAHEDHAGNPTSHCEPSGTTLTIAAQGTKFDKDCLAAPTGRPFTINFDNKDQTVHNLMILESHSANEALFDAGTIPTGIRTLNVPALQAGTFAFHCKIHPGQMSGTFVVA
jgi:plastocyanin